jgi:hypothetical protein
MPGEWPEYGSIKHESNEKTGAGKNFRKPVLKRDYKDDHCKKESPFDCFLPKGLFSNGVKLFCDSRRQRLERGQRVLQEVPCTPDQAKDANAFSRHQNDESQGGGKGT